RRTGRSPSFASVASESPPQPATTRASAAIAASVAGRREGRRDESVMVLLDGGGWSVRRRRFGLDAEQPEQVGTAADDLGVVAAPRAGEVDPLVVDEPAVGHHDHA